MRNKELTDSEILKVFECCYLDKPCEECPLCELQQAEKLCFNGDVSAIPRMLVELINRLQAELDDLKRDELPRCKEALERANEIGIELQVENERLKKEIENLESVQEISPEAKHFVDTKANKVISLLNEVIKSQEQIKAEAYKEVLNKVCVLENQSLINKTAAKKMKKLLKKLVGDSQ